MTRILGTILLFMLGSALYMVLLRWMTSDSIRPFAIEFESGSRSSTGLAFCAGMFVAIFNWTRRRPVPLELIGSTLAKWLGCALLVTLAFYMLALPVEAFAARSAKSSASPDQIRHAAQELSFIVGCGIAMLFAFGILLWVATVQLPDRESVEKQ